jgi:hypothetical protein
MAISIEWGTRIINVPRNDMTLIQSSPTEIRELNINTFRLALKSLEDDIEGMMFPDTHSHNAEVIVGGVTLAMVIEIINDYTITFEDGQYAVNLVGANSNIGDRVNVNQVSVRSANSAGMTSSPAIEYGSFNGGVTVDLLLNTVGTAYPMGTPLQPVGNLADALLIARTRGFNTIYVIGNATIDSGGDYSEMSFIGQSWGQSTLIISEASNVEGCHFKHATVQGILDGNSTLEDCRIGDLQYVSGYVEDCLLTAGTILLNGNARFLNCSGGIYEEDDLPTIDIGGSGATLAIRNYNGDVKLINKTSEEEVSIDLNSGRVVLDSTISSGVITIRGIGSLLDYSTGDAIINTNELISNESITEATWDIPITSHLISGSTGKALSSAGSAGDPWSTPMSSYTDVTTFGGFVSKKLLTLAKFLGLK